MQEIILLLSGFVVELYTMFGFLFKKIQLKVCKSK